MLPITINFDSSAKVNLILRQGDHYDKIIFVKKAGVDYDWADVTEIIFEVKESKQTDAKAIELSLSNGGIEISPGQLIIHLPSLKTNIPAKEYKSLELLIIFSSTKPKLWWDGSCIIKMRGTKLA